MIEVEVKVTTTTAQKVAVELPIFMQYEIDNDAYPSTFIFRRIDMVPGSDASPRFTAKTITKRPRGWGDAGATYEIEVTAWSFTGSSADYALGRGEHESSEVEFNAVADEAMAMLVGFKG